MSELDFSDVILLMVHLTTGRLAALKWLETGVDWFVEIGVQLSEIVSTICGSFHFLLTWRFFQLSANWTPSRIVRMIFSSSQLRANWGTSALYR